MISGLCIALVGIAGAVVLPTDTVTLSWIHTVEGTPWEEDYTIRDGALALTRARVKRSGAGQLVVCSGIHSVLGRPVPGVERYDCGRQSREACHEDVPFE